MIQTTKKCTTAIALSALIAGCGDSSSPEPSGPSLPELSSGSSSVILEMGGQSIAMNHFRAARFVDADGNQELRLFFSEDSLDGVVLIDFFGNDELRDFAFKDPERPKNLIDLRVPVDAPHGGYNGYIYPNQSLNMSGQSAFSELALTQDSVSGTISLQDFVVFDEDSPEWTTSGEFSAPITDVKMPGAIRGKEIVDSPQAKQLTAFMEALESGDIEQVRGLSTQQSMDRFEMMQKNMSAEDLKKMLTYASEEYGNTSRAFERGEGELYVAGKRALLTLTEKGEGYSTTMSMNFLWDNGRWLVN